MIILNVVKIFTFFITIIAAPKGMLNCFSYLHLVDIILVYVSDIVLNNLVLYV